MANYANLLATIAANIYQNGNNEVTADMVKAAMNAAVASLGAGYQFMGVAHPGDTPTGYADLKCFWLASEAGTYTDFGGSTILRKGANIIKYDGSWSVELLEQDCLAEIAKGGLQWMDGYYYHPTTFVLTANAAFATTIIYPAPLDELMSVAIESLISGGNLLLTFWKGGQPAGSRNNNGYRLPDLTPVASIDYDEFAVAAVKSGIPSYESTFRIPSLSEIVGVSETIGRGYYALGDSITKGVRSDNVSYADILDEKLAFTSYSKIAVSQCSCMRYYDAPKLSTQVAQVPNDFDGIISVMIGVNDCSFGVPIGDVAATIAKDYSALTEDTNFCDAFRLNMEGLKRKCPEATILCFVPLRVKPYPGTQVSEANLEPIRSAEREICEALSIPYFNSHYECGISVLCNWDDFMYDAVHPNLAGQELLAQYMSGIFRANKLL